MHSVLFLILAFFNAAGLFMLLGAEFLAMILVVVYVGAVAVLFLFVVMMLDVDFVELRQGFLQYLPIGGWSALSCSSSCLLVLGGWVLRAGPASSIAAAPIPAEVSNTAALGELLYTRYIFFFQAAGLVLLVAMIGAIVLTLRHKDGRQAPVDRRAECAHAGDRDRGPQGRNGEGALDDHRPGHYLTVAAILFTLGVFGIFLNRKNVIIILMSVELILLAVNINLVAFSAFLGDLAGQVFALLVLTVAAAEAAIGLAILVVFYRNRGSIAVEDVNMMKG